jgi:hypothetical protein
VPLRLRAGDGLKRSEKADGGPTALLWDGRNYLQMQVTPGSTFVSQSLPTSMTIGQPYMVRLTFSNTGLMPWLCDRNTRLTEIAFGTPFAPANALLNPGQIVPDGASSTFAFSVIPPSTPGLYPFQCGMFCVETGACGQESQAISITVS